MNKQLLTMNDLVERYQVARQTFYTWQKKHGFPKGLKIGGAAVRWRMEDLEKWEESRSAV